MCLLFVSCKSTKYFTEDADLCGLVVDEKNQPVSFFEMTCAGPNGTIENAVTNENGVFVFSNKKSGGYILSGCKNGWNVLSDKKVDFIDFKQIVCCKVWSFEKVIGETKVLVEKNNYEEALSVIEKVSVKEDTLIEIAVLFYKSYLNFKIGNLQESTEHYENLKRSINNQRRNFYFREEIKKLEELINIT